MYQALLAQTPQNERVVDFGFTHHMAKDASLFSSLDTTSEKKIYVAHDFALNINGHGDVTCQCGWIVDMFHVPSLCTNLVSVSQLTQTSKTIEFYPGHFFIKDLKKDRLIVTEEIFDPKDRLYKFCDLSRSEFGMTTFISQANKRSRL